MTSQPRKLISPAMAAVRQLRLGWVEQAHRDRAAAAAALLADARRTPPPPHLELTARPQRPGAREQVSLPPLPVGPNRCPTSCPYCIPASAEGGDGG